MEPTKWTGTRAFHPRRLAPMLGLWFLSSAAYAHTHTVNCPDDSKTFPTINSAIAASTPGATIIVCPGIYPENVVVNVDHLKIEAKITGTAKVVPGDPAGAGFLFTASYDQVLGFFVTGFDNGMYAGPGTGHEQIKNNFVFDNQEVGIFFESSTYNHVKNNKVIGNGAAGIFDDIAAVVPGEENVYDHDDVEYNGTVGIGLAEAVIIGPAPVKGIKVADRAHIEKSTVDNNTRDGIAFIGIGGTISHNDASYNGNNGIDLDRALNVDVRNNTANWNGASMTVCGPSEGTGECDGIRARNTTVSNTFSDNTAKLNLVWDAKDSSTGTGTAGTANTWTHDVCPKDSPNGICE